MPQISPKIILDTRFSSVEEFALNVNSWDIEFIQLDPGRLNARVFQLGMGEVMLGHYAFNRRFHQCGSSPKRVRTFGLVDPPGVRWCGRVADENSILVFPASSDYESFSSPDFSAWTISISEKKLHSISSSLGLPFVDEIAGGSGDAVIRCDNDLIEMLRHSITSICNAVSTAPHMINRTALIDELNNDIPVQLLTTLCKRRKGIISPSGNRMNAIRKAVEFMEANWGDVSIEDVCINSGVSWRTLDYAFKEYMGIGPKKYLEAFRLNRAYQTLYRSLPGIKVADIANNWGYWHMGRFAGNYKRFFGELPSETLLKQGPDQ